MRALRLLVLSCVSTVALADAPDAATLAEERGAALWSIEGEANGALPVAQPQTGYYGFGGGGRATVHFDVAKVLSVFARVGTLYFPQSLSSPLSGGSSLAQFGGGARLARAMNAGVVIPWVDAALEYVRTGPDNRVGVTGGVGVLFRFGSDSAWAVGPSARVTYVPRLRDEATYKTADAVVVSLGVAVAFTTFAERERVAESVKPVAELDSDGDGVLDADDACPHTAGPKSRRGCPDVDSDGDGVLDSDDACPKEAGPAVTKGCPDSDGDTVIDRIDNCPKVPGLPQDNGCPKYKQIVVTESRIELNQKIFFAFGLATILPKSFPLLDEVVQAVSDRSRLCMRIEGHTDSVGNAPRNLQLSQDRADAVRQYLIGHGIPPNTLASKGFGATLPLETNATPEGRERNRRVEFVVTSCSGLTP